MGKYLVACSILKKKLEVGLPVACSVMVHFGYFTIVQIFFEIILFQEDMPEVNLKNKEK